MLNEKKIETSRLLLYLIRFWWVRLMMRDRHTNWSFVVKPRATAAAVQLQHEMNSTDSWKIPQTMKRARVHLSLSPMYGKWINNHHFWSRAHIRTASIQSVMSATRTNAQTPDVVHERIKIKYNITKNERQIHHAKRCKCMTARHVLDDRLYSTGPGTTNSDSIDKMFVDTIVHTALACSDPGSCPCPCPCSLHRHTLTYLNVWFTRNNCFAFRFAPLVCIICVIIMVEFRYYYF